jgi:hypothetical protein
VVEGVEGRGSRRLADSVAIATEDTGKRVGRANMRLIRVEDCSLNIESRPNLVIKYIYISLFYKYKFLFMHF